MKESQSKVNKSLIPDLNGIISPITARAGLNVGNSFLMTLNSKLKNNKLPKLNRELDSIARKTKSNSTSALTDVQIITSELQKRLSPRDRKR